MPTPGAPPAGTASALGPSGPVLSLDPADILVYRYDETAGFQLLPNVKIVSDKAAEGPTPRIARYRYEFSDWADPVFPRRFEQVWGYGAGGPYVVMLDDRIVAFHVAPEDGVFTPVADGYAQIPQVDASDAGEVVTFECIGVEVSEFREAVDFTAWRDGTSDAYQAAQPAGSPRDISLRRPCRFNPDGRPNASPDGEDVQPAANPAQAYPVFYDDRIVRSPDARRYWTLGMAARYLMGAYLDGSIVAPPDFTTLDQELSAREPVAGVIDVLDAGTFTYEPIRCQDFDATGKTWPEALQQLIRPHGFALAFAMEPGGTGLALPRYGVVIYRREDGLWSQALYLQPAGTDLDLAWTNAPTLSLQADSHQVANSWSVLTALMTVEFAVILAPLFEPDPADDDPAAREKFAEGNRDFAGDNRWKYRVWGAGEAGDPWYDTEAGDWFDAPLDLGAVLYYSAPQTPEDRAHAYAYIRRPALRHLMTPGPNGAAREPELWVSADYDEWPVAGHREPMVYDRSKESTRHWQKVNQGGWELLEDRLGIRITADKPWNWQIGKPTDDVIDGAPFPGFIVDLIKCMNDPDPAAGAPRFVFRLTCAVEADIQTVSSARRRPASPGKFTTYRVADGRDRYGDRVVHRSSPLVKATAPDWTYLRDDEDAARKEAAARRRANEAARIAGTATIPYLSLAYDPGTLVPGLAGRGVGFNQFAGAAGDSPVYPCVAARERTYEPQRATLLQLADSRAEPDPHTERPPAQDAGVPGFVGRRPPRPQEPAPAVILMHRRDPNLRGGWAGQLEP